MPTNLIGITFLGRHFYGPVITNVIVSILLYKEILNNLFSVFDPLDSHICYDWIYNIRYKERWLNWFKFSPRNRLLSTYTAYTLWQKFESSLGLFFLVQLFLLYDLDMVLGDYTIFVISPECYYLDRYR